ncbi:pentapeptide repeat-containing protein [Actinokineospora globicatena]|nr:pentapeptide repeat-containing protein [Actinokineospora globicatena]
MVRRATFAGEVVFDGARFTGEASFGGAVFDKRASFRRGGV